MRLCEQHGVMNGANDHACPYCTIAGLEEMLEHLWEETDGILPTSGKYWLTPRMEREARAVEKWLKEDDG